MTLALSRSTVTDQAARRVAPPPAAPLWPCWCVRRHRPLRLPPPRPRARPHAPVCLGLTCRLAAWLGFWGPEHDAITSQVELVLHGVFDRARSEALGNEPLAQLLYELMKYEEAVGGSKGERAGGRAGGGAVAYQLVPKHWWGDARVSSKAAKSTVLTRHLIVPGNNKCLCRTATGVHGSMAARRNPHVGWSGWRYNCRAA